MSCQVSNTCQGSLLNKCPLKSPLSHRLYHGHKSPGHITYPQSDRINSTESSFVLVHDFPNGDVTVFILYGPFYVTVRLISNLYNTLLTRCLIYQFPWAFSCKDWFSKTCNARAETDKANTSTVHRHRFGALCACDKSCRSRGGRWRMQTPTSRWKWTFLNLSTNELKLQSARLVWEPEEKRGQNAKRLRGR